MTWSWHVSARKHLRTAMSESIKRGPATESAAEPSELDERLREAVAWYLANGGLAGAARRFRVSQALLVDAIFDSGHQDTIAPQGRPMVMSPSSLAAREYLSGGGTAEQCAVRHGVTHQAVTEAARRIRRRREAWKGKP